ncbi:hypothetical protein DER45DRAFT_624342 [Fusarium avenaceum]|nr:hypothetical protein DER45DRAFT_624342 [Fusarium avenaceum]
MIENARRGTASLELLPSDILLLILGNFPSLDLLWNFLRASPRVWRLFGVEFLTITEGILSGPSSIIPPKVRELIRGVILIRSGAIPFENLEEFQCRFMRGMIPFLVSQNTPLKTLGPESLSSSAGATVFRSVVATAYHISALSQAYLASCLERLRGPGFRPLHAHDPKPHYTHGYGPDDMWVRAWDRQFTGAPVPIVDMGQPTWVEEMRVIRAMWIIQLMGEVQCLVADNPETIGWSDNDVSTIRGMGPVDLFHDRESQICDTEPIKSAIYYLTTRNDCYKDVFYRLPKAPTPSADNRWITGVPNRNERTMQLKAFRLNNKLHYLRKGSTLAAVPEGAIPVELPVLTEAHHWEQTEDAFDNRPYGISFWIRLRNNDMLVGSPIPGVKFDSFRPLGLAFWDRRRLYLLGLASGIGTGGCDGDHFYFFAWESILPPEEVEIIKAALRDRRIIDLS